MPANYSGQNLRGRSFKNQDLTGADFSGADIRGADFSGANLRGAKFVSAKAGLQHHWVIGLVVVSLVISMLSGSISAISSYWIALFFNPEIIQYYTIFPGVVVLTALIPFFIFTVRQGLGAASAAVAILGAMVGAGVAGMAGGLAGKMVVQVTGEAVPRAGAGAVTAAVAVAMTVVTSGAITAAGVIAEIGAVVAAVVVSMAVAVLGAMAVVKATTETGRVVATALGSAVAAGVVAIAMALLSFYVAWRALAEDKNYVIIRQIAIAFAAYGGTSFYEANLTNADFTSATLKNTDFRKANLTHTCFHQAQKLDFVHHSTSYLQNPNLRQVLTTGQGQDRNFDRQDLRGVNFRGANLVNASFIGADLSEANLQDADLSTAKLVQTQLDGTDFTGANLTGAYIEDWNITNTTNFTGVRCQYIYMRLPTKDNPEPHRKPDNREEVFGDGEFGDFIKPIVDTLDLYHTQGVDPRAIAISFKQLAENHPDAELRIVGMEVKGEDKLLLRAKTATNVDKSELSVEYFDTYNYIKTLSEREVKLLLVEKDSRIRSLETMVITALERPNFYSNTQVGQVGTMTNNPGGFSVGGSVAGNINNLQGDNNKVNQGDTTMTGERNIHMGSGNYNERIERDYIQGKYYAAGQPQSLAQAAAEIQELLKQLEQTYPTTTTSQQMVVAAEAINRIESSPTMKQKVINAVKEGGLAAFEKAIDNPAGAFVVGAIKGWQEIEVEAKD